MNSWLQKAILALLGPKQAKARSSRTKRLILESLEDRRLMATRVWDAGGLSENNWTNRFNWEGNTAPVSGDTLVFPTGLSIPQSLMTNDFQTGTLFNKLEFRGSSYQVHGNPISLGPGGIVTATAGSGVVGMPVTLSNAHTPLNVAGFGLTLSGAISGSGGLTKSGQGSLLFRGESSNTYSGVTEVRAGTLRLLKSRNGAEALAVSGPLVIGNSADQTNQPIVRYLVGIASRQLGPSATTTIEANGTLQVALVDSPDAPRLKVALMGNLVLRGGNITGDPGAGIRATSVRVEKSSRIDVDEVSCGLVFVAGNRVTGMQTLQINAERIDQTLIKTGGGELRLGFNLQFAELVLVHEGHLVIRGLRKAIRELHVGTNAGAAARAVVFQTFGDVVDGSSVTINKTGTVQFQGDTLAPLGTVLWPQLTMAGGRLQFDGSEGQQGVSVNKLLVSASSQIIGTGSVLPLHGIEINATSTLLVGANLQTNGALLVTGGGTVNLTAPQQSQSVALVIDNSTVQLPNGMSRADVLARGTFDAAGVVRSVFTGPRSDGKIAALRPGGSAPGKLSAERFSLAGSALQIQLNGTEPGTRYDQLAVTSSAPGSLSLFAQLEVTLNFQSAVGDVFAIVDHQTSADLKSAGFFLDKNGNQLIQGSTLVVNGQSFVLNYGSTAANDITLTHVNTPPAFANRQLTPAIVEGGVVTLSGHITEPDSRDTFFLDVNWGDGAVQTYRFAPGTPRDIQVKHRYTDDVAGSDDRYRVQLVWRDQHGGRNSAVLTTTVRNDAPDLGEITASLPPLVVGQPITIQGTIHDSGRLDGFKVHVRWDTGGAWQSISLPAGSTSFTLKHTYATPGHHRVTVLLIDDDLDLDEVAFLLNVTT